jgi:hypothetical protein
MCTVCTFQTLDAKEHQKSAKEAKLNQAFSRLQRSTPQRLAQTTWKGQVEPELQETSRGRHDAQKNLPMSAISRSGELFSS